MRLPKITGKRPAYDDAEIIKTYETHPRYIEERKSLGEAYSRQLRQGHGWLGSHRRYLGYRRSGNIQALLTCLLFLCIPVFGHGYIALSFMAPAMAWFLKDLCLLPKMTREANQRLLRQIAHEEGGMPFHDPETAQAQPATTQSGSPASG